MSTPNRRHLRWLRDELPELVERRLIDAGAAARLTDHYRLSEVRAPRNLALLIFGTLGALLVGGGLILIVAHNWDGLARPPRAALALGLLVASQALGAFPLWRRPASGAWTEGSGLLITAALGASMALISQTYNVQAETGDFVLTWLALALPVPYLLDARLAAGACLVLALFLPGTRQALEGSGLSYLLALAAVLPYVARVSRARPDAGRTRLLQWLSVITVPIGLAVLLLDGALRDAEALALPFFTALFAVMSLGGARGAGGGPGQVPRFSTPLATAGLLGLWALVLAMTFEDPWPWESLASMRGDLAEPVAGITLLCAVALSALPLRAAWRALAEGRWAAGLFFAAPLLPLVGLPLSALARDALTAQVLANAYVLALGVATVAAGLAEGSMGRTNLGLALLSLLFVLRFVDSDLSLVTRGVAMVLVGAGLAAVNLWLLRRARDGTPGAGGPPRENPRGGEPTATEGKTP